MITNERQYKITRSKAKRFADAIKELDVTASERGKVHPRLVQAEREGMESVLEELQKELAEYEELQNSEVSVISGVSIDELAIGLIKARIARGLTQRQLAERLGMKEQQVQRYEAELYASTSYSRLCKVAHALGVQIKNEIHLPLEPGSFDALLSKVSQVGMAREFVVERLLSTSDASIAKGDVPDERSGDWLTGKTTLVLERVFGWTRENILGVNPLSVDATATADVPFQMPTQRRGRSTRIFSTYARHLAIAAIQGMSDRPSSPIPTDPSEMRRAILNRGNGIDDLRSALHAVWDLGVVVLPLKGKGSFHGACWRFGGRNAIVLTQTSIDETRWIFDLLHELHHVAQRPEEPNFEHIETDTTSREPQESQDEIQANQFAGDVMLNCNANALANRCTTLAQKQLPRLKDAVRRVASEGGVNEGALANYLASQLFRNDISWSFEASNLQRKNGDPWQITRDVFFERHLFQIKNEIDRSLLQRALN